MGIDSGPSVSSAISALEEAMVRDAASGWMEGELDDGRAIPLPSDIENHLQNKDHQDCAWMLVDIDMSKLSDKTERLNICLPSRALRRLDSLAANLAKTIFSLKD